MKRPQIAVAVTDTTRNRVILATVHRLASEYPTRASVYELDGDEGLAALQGLADLLDIARPDTDVRGCSCGMADYGTPGHDGSTDPEEKP